MTTMTTRENRDRNYSFHLSFDSFVRRRGVRSLKQQQNINNNIETFLLTGAFVTCTHTDTDTLAHRRTGIVFGRGLRIDCASTTFVIIVFIYFIETLPIGGLSFHLTFTT